jgi:Skp family chaperone for outer membrane proteins
VIESVYPGNSAVMQSIRSEEQIMNDNLNEIKEKILQITDQKSAERNDSVKFKYDKQIDDLKKKYAEYYKVSKDKIEKKIKDIREPMLGKIRECIKSIAESEEYSMVMDSNSKSLFFYDIEDDITQKIIDRLKGKK